MDHYELSNHFKIITSYFDENKALFINGNASKLSKKNEVINNQNEDNGYNQKINKLEKLKRDNDGYYCECKINKDDNKTFLKSFYENDSNIITPISSYPPNQKLCNNQKKKEKTNLISCYKYNNLLNKQNGLQNSNEINLNNLSCNRKNPIKNEYNEKFSDESINENFIQLFENNRIMLSNELRNVSSNDYKYVDKLRPENVPPKNKIYENDKTNNIYSNNNISLNQKKNVFSKCFLNGSFTYNDNINFNNISNEDISKKFNNQKICINKNGIKNTKMLNSYFEQSANQNDHKTNSRNTSSKEFRDSLARKDNTLIVNSDETKKVTLCSSICNIKQLKKMMNTSEDSDDALFYKNIKCLPGKLEGDEEKKNENIDENNKYHNKMSRNKINISQDKINDGYELVHIYDPCFSKWKRVKYRGEKGKIYRNDNHDKIFNLLNNLKETSIFYYKNKNLHRYYSSYGKRDNIYFDNYEISNDTNMGLSNVCNKRDDNKLSISLQEFKTCLFRETKEKENKVKNTLFMTILSNDSARFSSIKKCNSLNQNALIKKKNNNFDLSVYSKSMVVISMNKYDICENKKILTNNILWKNKDFQNKQFELENINNEKMKNKTDVHNKNTKRDTSKKRGRSSDKRRNSSCEGSKNYGTEKGGNNNMDTGDKNGDENDNDNNENNGNENYSSSKSSSNCSSSSNGSSNIAPEKEGKADFDVYYEPRAKIYNSIKGSIENNCFENMRKCLNVKRCEIILDVNKKKPCLSFLSKRGHENRKYKLNFTHNIKKKKIRKNRYYKITNTKKEKAECLGLRKDSKKISRRKLNINKSSSYIDFFTKKYNSISYIDIKKNGINTYLFREKIQNNDTSLQSFEKIDKVKEYSNTTFREIKTESKMDLDNSEKNNDIFGSDNITVDLRGTFSGTSFRRYKCCENDHKMRKEVDWNNNIWNSGFEKNVKTSNYYYKNNTVCEHKAKTYESLVTEKDPVASNKDTSKKCYLLSYNNLTNSCVKERGMEMEVIRKKNIKHNINNYDTIDTYYHKYVKKGEILEAKKTIKDKKKEKRKDMKKDSTKKKKKETERIGRNNKWINKVNGNEDSSGYLTKPSCTINENGFFFNNRYYIIGLIYYGYNSQVYKCINIKDKKTYAMKVVLKERENYEMVKNELNIDKFMKKYMFLKKNPHKNIIPIYDIFSDNNYNFIIMEFCKGSTLLDYFMSLVPGSLHIYEIKKIMKNIFLALDFLHSRGLIHRDIKLENIMFTKKKMRNFNYKQCDNFDLDNYTDPFFLFEEKGKTCNRGIVRNSVLKKCESKIDLNNKQDNDLFLLKEEIDTIHKVDVDKCWNSNGNIEYEIDSDTSSSDNIEWNNIWCDDRYQDESSYNCELIEEFNFENSSNNISEIRKKPRSFDAYNNLFGNLDAYNCDDSSNIENNSLDNVMGRNLVNILDNSYNFKLGKIYKNGSTIQIINKNNFQKKNIIIKKNSSLTAIKSKRSEEKYLINSEKVKYRDTENRNNCRKNNNDKKSSFKKRRKYFPCNLYDNLCLIDMDMMEDISNNNPNKNKKQNIICGTASYMSPESFDGILSASNDIWACGVILYALMDGRFPYEIYNTMPNYLKKKILRYTKPNFDPFIWQESPDLLDLCLRLLDPNPLTRIQNAKEALIHCCFSDIV
ncbi:serine/threonine protein kinase, putative [Plasmodium berghei]|uniref:Serine/threonine protein kinase, putative n=2 Tax=Plasmodium berghei TaxID=5821 RepID=A0A509AK70_PLABA|nr:serine/threonine protein kinase, putative [Plasmodium berghei ANKA]CXH95629.1 serine/threonine protein kinase, putative [Plasmodium berghei]SCL91042.1 serine/threonine protein kinase, putative [Plasmodium berghei]SCM15412.1 serine/threonine protein kinase, putative [Plasmodium berghei]SCM17207.1 serine/threonine protein kinase, putative [Plasmodium berghei]SCN22276.1 serine/threonine protein kinase, putative [Plasmodium berghei]|eukprot:XP_034419997.1 serine/threonine protein kinase, putative [Plasmodium berghei ANKA]